MGQKFSKTRMASNLLQKITRDTCETKTGSTNSFKEKVKNNLNNLKDFFDCLEGKHHATFITLNIRYIIAWCIFIDSPSFWHAKNTDC